MQTYLRIDCLLLLLPAECAQHIRRYISVTHGVNFEFFCPEGANVAPIRVKFGVKESTRNVVGRSHTRAPMMVKFGVYESDDSYTPNFTIIGARV